MKAYLSLESIECEIESRVKAIYERLGPGELPPSPKDLSDALVALQAAQEAIRRLKNELAERSERDVET